jgi:hypothetical protein
MTGSARTAAVRFDARHGCPRVREEFRVEEFRVDPIGPHLVAVRGCCRPWTTALRLGPRT